MTIYPHEKNRKLPAVEGLTRAFAVREKYEEHVADCEGLDILVTWWKGNKLVMLASSQIGPELAHTVNRHDKKTKETNFWVCKSRQEYIRLLYPMIDTVVINSWVLYKKNNPNLAERLCLYKKYEKPKRGIPSKRKGDKS